MRKLSVFQGDLRDKINEEPRLIFNLFYYDLASSRVKKELIFNVTTSTFSTTIGITRVRKCIRLRYNEKSM